MGVGASKKENESLDNEAGDILDVRVRTPNAKHSTARELPCILGNHKYDNYIAVSIIS